MKRLGAKAGVATTNEDGNDNEEDEVLSGDREATPGPSVEKGTILITAYERGESVCRILRIISHVSNLKSVCPNISYVESH